MNKLFSIFLIFTAPLVAVTEYQVEPLTKTSNFGEAFYSHTPTGVLFGTQYGEPAADTPPILVPEEPKEEPIASAKPAKRTAQFFAYDSNSGKSRTFSLDNKATNLTSEHISSKNVSNDHGRVASLVSCFNEGHDGVECEVLSQFVIYGEPMSELQVIELPKSKSSPFTEIALTNNNELVVGTSVQPEFYLYAESNWQPLEVGENAASVHLMTSTFNDVLMISEENSEFTAVKSYAIARNRSHQLFRTDGCDFCPSHVNKKLCVAGECDGETFAGGDELFLRDAKGQFHYTTGIDILDLSDDGLVLIEEGDTIETTYLFDIRENRFCLYDLIQNPSTLKGITRVLCFGRGDEIYAETRTPGKAPELVRIIPAN